MTGLERALDALLSRLRQEGRRFALVGGLAVSARTEPRFTRDADVCVAVEDDADAERLVHALSGAGYVVDALVEQEATGRLATVRLSTGPDRDDGDDWVVLDLLFASSGVEHEVIEGAEELEVFEGLRAPIASVGALIALKILSRDDLDRPQDRVDLVALLRVATTADLEETARLLGLVTDRGYDRGRDLPAALTELREARSG